MDKMRTRVVNIVNIVNDCTLRNIRGYIRGYNYITNYEHFDWLSKNQNDLYYNCIYSRKNDFQDTARKRVLDNLIL